MGQYALDCINEQSCFLLCRDSSPQRTCFPSSLVQKQMYISDCYISIPADLVKNPVKIGLKNRVKIFPKGPNTVGNICFLYNVV